MKSRDQDDEEYFNLEDLKRYMSLPVEEKLRYLQEINAFFNQFMPPENKKVWEELKKAGW